MKRHLRIVILAMLAATSPAVEAAELSLCAAALHAAGVGSPGEIERHLSRFEDLCKTARARVPPVASPRERAALLLTVLHQEVLTGSYNPNLWNVGDTLDNGTYNCLTATLLYLDLCERFGLPASAIHSPGHLRCRVEGRSPFLVEPTCARWFELASAIPQSKVGRALDRDQLLAKVHYNRASALLAEDRFAEAIACLITSRHLDPLDSAARENEAAARHNWAMAIGKGLPNLTRPDF